MPSDKVKLFPEAKRTLLELGLKRILDKQKSEEEELDPEEELDSEEKLAFMFNFVKMLCVTNSYLTCSRQIYLDIYRLNLRFDQDSDKIEVMLTSKCYEFPDMNCASLTYEYVEKLIKLLLPSHIGVSFGHNITDADMLEQCLNLLKFTKEKIGLKLGGLSDQSVQTLFETFTTRIHGVFFEINRFDLIESLGFPAFDQLSVSSISDSGQVSQVLRHRIKAKELGLDFAYQGFTIDDKDVGDLKNETVKKLKLTFDSVDYVKIEKSLKQLHKSCLNLKHLDIKARFSHDDEFSNNQVYGKVIAYVNHMQDLKASFGNVLASMHIKFEIIIDVIGRRDNTWIKSVCKNSAFKDWQFKSSGRYWHAENAYYDKLEMNFDNTGCRLEMTIDVATYDDDAENEDSSDDE